MTDTKIWNDGRLPLALNPIRQMKTGTLSLVCVAAAAAGIQRPEPVSVSSSCMGSLNSKHVTGA